MGVMIQYIRIYLRWPIQGVPTTNEIYLLIPPLGVGYRGSLTSPAGALYSAAPVIIATLYEPVPVVHAMKRALKNEFENTFKFGLPVIYYDSYEVLKNSLKSLASPVYVT